MLSWKETFEQFVGCAVRTTFTSDTGVGAGYDLADGYEGFVTKQYTLGSLYLVRSAAQTGVSGLSIAIGLAKSGPFLEYMIKRHGNNVFIRPVLKYAAHTSGALAARSVFMLRIFFGLNILIFAITVGLIYFVPNDLQRYLSHSTFRKDRSNGIADTEEKEIEIMQRAVGSTL